MNRIDTCAPAAAALLLLLACAAVLGAAFLGYWPLDLLKVR